MLSIAIRFVFLMLCICLQAQEQPTISTLHYVTSQGAASPVVYANQDEAGKWSIGSSTFRFKDEQLRAIYHEKWEWKNGELRILQPMAVIVGEQRYLLGAVGGLEQQSSGDSQIRSFPRVVSVKTPMPAVQLAVGPAPKTVCGLNEKNTSSNVSLVQVSCLDYEYMRNVVPEVAWPPGTETQVLIHAWRGSDVRVTVDGEVKYAEMITDAEGRRIAMVRFPGILHSALTVKVLDEVQ